MLHNATVALAWLLLHELEPNSVRVTEDKMLNSSCIKKQCTLNSPSRWHIHFSQPQKESPTPSGWSFLSRSALDKTHNLRSCCSPTHDCERTGLLARKPKRTNQCACLGGGFGVLLHSLGTTRQDQNLTSVCLLGTCSTWSC